MTGSVPISNLREQLEEAKKRRLKAQEDERRIEEDIAQSERRCNHDWTPAVFDPVKYSGGWCEGDPPEVMGVDRRPASYWPARQEDRWRRTCRLCGKIEYTQKVDEIVTKEPRW